MLKVMFVFVIIAKKNKDFVFQDRVSLVALELILELALVDQAGSELMEIHLSLPPGC